MINRFNSLKAHINKIGFKSTIRYLMQRILKKRGELIKVNIPRLPYPIYLRNKFYDTNIFYQIFIREELNFNLKTIPEIIIDCGANIGLSTLFFKMKYPMCNIYSIEPEISNFKMLQLNTKNYENIFPIHMAVWHTNSTINIIDNGKGNASFITNSIPGSKNIIGTVMATTIDNIVFSNSISCIDLLKMDIEGSEFDIFNNKTDWIKRTKCIAVEIHEMIRPGVTEIINNVMDKDFEIINNGEYTIYTKQTILK